MVSFLVDVTTAALRIKFRNAACKFPVRVIRAGGEADSLLDNALAYCIARLVDCTLNF